ncbi:hypothetical protein CH267_00190 [Rhodococcus sp. 06-621-2]|nr:hypothetical protein [Rhodococcus sp. 06-621-2]OZC62813.1 hypothetical protein CH267_00190 [Rhodococcus sp. 06-621-2]
MVKILDDDARAALVVAAHRPGLRSMWAKHTLATDDRRRRNRDAAEQSNTGDGFDRTTLKLTDRGFVGPGGGRTNTVGRQVEYRATSVQAAGLWPWSVGAGAPLIGTPIGQHLVSRAAVCFDLLNWFIEGLITAPVGFVLGLNGYGKSSFVRRVVLGGIAQNVTTLVLADVKPDYRQEVEAVGGQTIDLGYGYGRINPLAGGVLGSTIPKLDAFPELQRRMLAELRGRQVQVISGLIELSRGGPVHDYEETIIATSLNLLYGEMGFTPDKPPLLGDFLDLVIAGHPELIADAGEDTAEDYRRSTKRLRQSLRGLIKGRFGEVFNGHTTTEIDIDSVAICIDVSHIPEGDTKLKAAVMLVCWSDGFAAIEAAHALADAGLGPQRYFQAIMDELWQVLGLGDFMVDRVNALTRLNRAIATALWMITHTVTDLESQSTTGSASKALGFLERARVKVIGPIPEKEVERLSGTVKFTSTESEMVTGWSAPPPMTGDRRRSGEPIEPPSGLGKFLIKIGESELSPGIPVQLIFSAAEIDAGIHDTNSRFSEFADASAVREVIEDAAVHGAGAGAYA